jgi:DNA-binding NtrC family response regulator
VAQLAQTSLERKMNVGAPMLLTGASGIDPVPVLARAFLMGPRRDAPFVVVDGTASQEHDLARWMDPALSPLALVDGGLLLLLDAAALPSDVQELLARVHAERRPPWERPEPLEFQLAAFVVEPSEASRARMASSLEARLSAAFDDPVRLPRLRERAEDLRGVLIDRLAREGLRVRGTPVGLHDSAFAELVDHPFDGEDAELASIVIRLVARAQSVQADVVRVEDVRALGLVKAQSRAEHLRLVGKTSSRDGDT